MLCVVVVVSMVVDLGVVKKDPYISAQQWLVDAAQKQTRLEPYEGLASAEK